MGSKKWIRKKVVAYCRVSTLEQKKNGYGIDIQIRDVTLFAGLQNLFVEKFYKDEGESGVKEERNGLRQLLKACQAGQIGVVILPSLDRLSREVRITENLFHEFQKLHVKILIADMPQYNDGDRKDIFIRQIFEAFAEENRREIIERLWKGRQERTRKGLFPGGNLPYGYARENKAILINTQEAEIVREILTLSAQGCPEQAISDALNDNGHIMRNGKSWTQRQVCRILWNSKLYQEGIFHYGEVTGEDKSLIIFDE